MKKTITVRPIIDSWEAMGASMRRGRRIPIQDERLQKLIEDYRASGLSAKEFAVNKISPLALEYIDSGLSILDFTRKINRDPADVAFDLMMYVGSISTLNWKRGDEKLPETLEGMEEYYAKKREEYEKTYSKNRNFITSLIEQDERFIETLRLDRAIAQYLWKSVFEFDKIKERVERRKETFAFPAHGGVMFTLVSLFAGKSLSPRVCGLLQKPKESLSPQEEEERQAFLEKIFFTEKTLETDIETLEQITRENPSAVVCDSLKIKATSPIQHRLFCGSEEVHQEALALHIKKTYGPEGLRHLFGLLIGLEDAGRKGSFEWKMNEHLARLGYTKDKGAYPPELKKKAVEIIRVFTSFTVSAVQKEGKGERVSFDKLFSIEGGSYLDLAGERTDQKIKIRATDFWYQKAFEDTGDQGPQYTKLLRELAKVNHREHSLALFLAPLLALWWRIGKESKQSLSTRKLLEWCNIDHSPKNPNRAYHLKNLEAELHYMVEHGFLGGFATKGADELKATEGRVPTFYKDDPFDTLMEFTPPQWLGEAITAIKEKQDKALPPVEGWKPSITRESLKGLLEKSGLSQGQFAGTIGTTRQALNAMINGARSITRKTEGKIKEKFGHLISPA